VKFCVPIYYFNFNPRLDRTCRHLSNKRPFSLRNSHTLELLFIKSYARLHFSFFPASALVYFRRKKPSPFYFRPIKITHVYTMFALIFSVGRISVRAVALNFCFLRLMETESYTDMIFFAYKNTVFFRMETIHFY
jgi:hypothetical protein